MLPTNHVTQINNDPRWHSYCRFYVGPKCTGLETLGFFSHVEQWRIRPLILRSYHCEENPDALKNPLIQEFLLNGTLVEPVPKMEGQVNATQI